MGKDGSQNRKGLTIGLLLVSATVLLYVLFLLIVFRFQKNGSMLSGAQPGTQFPPPVPNGADYNISKLAECVYIWDYYYDRDGRLIHSYGYKERDDNSGRWAAQREELCYYDTDGELVRKEQYYPYLDAEVPAFITTYQYDRHSGERTETVRDVDDGTEKRTVYDREGRLLEKDGYIYYYGDTTGKLYSISDFDEESGKWLEVSTLRWSLVDFYSIETMKIAEGRYVAWLDFYDQNWQKTSGVWLVGGTENRYRMLEEIELYGLPGYYADYSEGRLVEEMIYERTKDLDRGYESHCYNFYDYDEEGRMTWEGYALTFDDRLILYQYLYNEEGQMARELHYRIYGDWEQPLSDGSTVALHRNEEGLLTDITRTGANGEMINSFLFNEDRTLEYQLGTDGTVKTYWQLTGREYLAMLEGGEPTDERDDPTAPAAGALFYVVKAGDSLWGIAEKLWGDGELWPLLYEENRGLIGEDPGLILKGTELKIPCSNLQGTPCL